MNVALLAHLTDTPHAHSHDVLALVVALLIATALWAGFRRAR
jgi:hypothetical protein